MEAHRYETIVVDLADGVCTLTMNRPDRLNGMTNLMLFETFDALTRLAGDDTLRVLVLTGAGRGFCPGADLLVLSVGDPGPELETRWFQVPVLLHEMPAVTVSAVNGACAGAGLGWAAACDIRLASDTARFNTAFLDVSVAGDMGLPWSLPRLVGAARARDLSFFPRKFTAAEALELGLVTAVFAADAFRDDVVERIARLARFSPDALRTLKLHYVAGERIPFTDLVELESAHHLTLLRDADPDAALATAAARTAVQRAHDVDDDAEQLREDILAYGRRKNDPATVDVYIRHQLDTYTWLTQHGVEFGLIDTGTSEVSRVHTTPPGWLTGFLHEKFVARGGTEYLGSFHGAADLSGAALGKAAVFGRAAGLESSAGEGSYTR